MSSRSIDVRTILGPGFTGTPINLAVSSGGETSDINPITLAKPTLNNPSDFGGFAGENDQAMTVMRNAKYVPSRSFQIFISPSNPPRFTEPTATIDVKRAPPEITSVSPTLVSTPQSLRPGTEVTIKGEGFCRRLDCRVRQPGRDGNARLDQSHADQGRHPTARDRRSDHHLIRRRPPGRPVGDLVRPHDREQLPQRRRLPVPQLQAAHRL